MTYEEDNRVRELVRELDQLIPRPGALVRSEDAGQGRHRLLANRQGYLRLGIELLRGGLRKTITTEEGVEVLDINPDYLWSGQGSLEEFAVNEEIASLPPVRPTSWWREGMGNVGFIAGGLFLAASVLIGAGTILKAAWLWLESFR